MNLAKNLPDVNNIDFYACLQCGYCASVCPTYNYGGGWESHSPRGKLYLLKQLYQESEGGKKNVDVDPRIIDRMFYCSSCGACAENCHVEINLLHIWEKVREWFVEKKFELPESVAGVKGTIDTFHSPYVAGFGGVPPVNRNQDIIDKYKLPEKAEVVFFVGCVSSTLLIKIMNSAIKILQKAEVDFTVLKDEWCCGNILGSTGQGHTDVFAKNAKHNFGAVKETGAKTMLTCCPGCYRSFSAMHPEFYKKPDFKVLHFTEFVADLMKQGKIEFKKDFDKVVAYHDPCELGRLSGIFDPPRDILKSVPGLDFREMPNNREEGNCCGNGGGFNNREAEVAMQISFAKIDTALEMGADVIVSACPNCRFGLSNAIIEKKTRIEDAGGTVDFKIDMMDITEVLGKVVK
jgi:heterodisulfide reductase subunit D